MSVNRRIRLILLSILYFILVFVPLIVSVADADISKVSFTLRHILLLTESIRLAVITALISGVLGIFCALYIHNSFLSDKWYRYYFVLFLPVPFYIYALSWTYFIRSMSHIFPAVVRYSMSGLGAGIFAEVLGYYPISVLFALIGMERISDRDIEQAYILGSGERVIWKIVIKEIWPYILTSFGLIIILSMTDFSVPAMFQINTYTLDLFSLYGRTGDAGSVFIMTVPMLMVLVIPFLWLIGGIRRFGISPSRQSTIRIKPGKITGTLSFAAFAISIIQIIIPLVTIIVKSVKGRVLTDAIVLVGDELEVSLIVSVLAGVFGVFLALSPAIIMTDTDSLILCAITLMPVAIPGAIEAMGLLKLVNMSPFYAIGRTDILCATGCALKIVPLIIVIICIYRRYIDKRKLEMARLLAVKESDALRLEYKLMLPGIVAAFALVFFLTYAEEGVFLVLMAPGREAITVKIYNYLHYGASDYVCAFCLTALSAVIVIEAAFVAIYRAILKRYYA